VKLNSLPTPSTIWSIVPAPDDDDDDDDDDDEYECRAVSEMRIKRRNGSTRDNPAPVPLCAP
jgi:hypothetical protein